jgi:polar amino acid transport system substrate-binding protein
MQNHAIAGYAGQRSNLGVVMKLLWVCCLLSCSLTVSAQALRVGFGTHKPPYIFENEARGLEYDIVMTAAQRGGLEPEAYYAPMERLNLMLSKDQIDVIATTNERSGGAIFYSDAYIRYQNVAVALRSRNYKIERIADLSNYSVSAFQRARFLLGREFQRMAQSNPRYREEAQQIARNRLLYSGRIEVVVADIRILRYLNREVLHQVDVSQPLAQYSIFAPTPYQVGFRREAQRNRFNQGLAEIRANGEYRAIERRYAMY